MMRRYCMPGAVGLALVLLLSGAAAGIEDACRWESGNRITVPVQENPAIESGDRDLYSGTIRVYVTEITGRWDDENGVPFHNAFLSFALEESVILSETDSLMWSLQWDGHDYTDMNGLPYSDVREDNIKVTAAVFNSASYTGYSDPPSGYPFAVHEVDAAAGAKCGGTGYNLTASDFTHSVFVEDGSTTW